MTTPRCLRPPAREKQKSMAFARSPEKRVGEKKCRVCGCVGVQKHLSWYKSSITFFCSQNNDPRPPLPHAAVQQPRTHNPSFCLHIIIHLIPFLGRVRCSTHLSDHQALGPGPPPSYHIPTRQQDTNTSRPENLPLSSRSLCQPILD